MTVAEEFADGKLVLECPEITIEQSGKIPLNLKGPGRIELNGRRIEWSFHVSAEQRQKLHPIRVLGLGALRSPGSVLPKEEYVAFQATTFGRDVWTSAVAQDPQIAGTVGGAGIVSGYAFTLKNTKPAEANGREYVRLYVPGKVTFPALFWTDTVSRGPGETQRLLRGARDWAQFESGEERFTLCHEGSHTEIFCDLTTGAVAAQRHQRMQEALTFALGQILHPCAVEITVDGTQTTVLYEWSALGRDARTQDPPLNFGDDLPLEEVYDIVRAYYRKVSTWTLEEESPIAHGVFSVVHAAQNTLDLHLFQLASAAETLIKNANLDLPSSEPELRAEAQTLWKKVKALDQSEELRHRLGNAFGLVLQPNPIKDFVQYRGLPDSVFTSWRQLRNRAAHGTKAPLDDLQALWKRRSDVLQLCYSIVFAFIGYEGTYTDYTKPRGPYSGKLKIASE